MTQLHKLPAALLFTLCLAAGGSWLAYQLTPAHAGETPRAVSVSTPEHAGLVLEIQGIRHTRGRLMVMIYDDESAWEAYDEQRMAAYYEFDAVDQGVRLDFDSLTAGPYAIALWHDENGDGALNMEGGYPLEGYGTSGARDAYDEVPFHRAAVEPGVVEVLMYYPDW